MSESNLPDSEPVGTSDPQPRAMIHKKVLDIAESEPDASLDDIAESVSGASAKFVERVLDEYGDPAATSREQEQDDEDGNGNIPNGTEAGAPKDASGPTADQTPSNKTMATDDPNTEKPSDTEDELLNSGESEPRDNFTDNESSVDIDDADASKLKALNERQKRTLKVVHESPAATQEEIAEQLNVTRAAVSKRLNNIPNFEWKRRREFTSQIFDHEQNKDGQMSEQDNPNETISKLDDRITAVEQQLESTNNQTDSELPPELLHKLIHSCMDADYFTEEEELELLRHFL